jgi:hypothetical protein
MIHAALTPWKPEFFLAGAAAFVVVAIIEFNFFSY